MDIQKLLKEKEIKDKVKQQHQEMVDIYNGETTSNLSKKDVELGLILINCFPALRENYDPEETNPYFSYNEDIVRNGKRFQKLLEFNASGDIWTRHQALITYLFGEDMAPFVQDALKMFPGLMYQTGWSRRSFRAPNATDIHLELQANFIINLINEDKYDFSLQEYLLHSNHVGYYNNPFMYLWAAALNQQEANISDLIFDIIYNRHETAKVSRGTIKAMLLSDREDAWEAVIKLLLSAQRQEGLRQTILECLDETSLGAMKALIDVIIEHKLGRFSSVVRAIDVWAGFGWESERETTVKRFLGLAQEYLNHPDKIDKAVESKDNAEVYMALWAQGVFDVMECMPLLEKIFAKNQIEKSALALYFINQLELYEISKQYGAQFIRHDNLLVMAAAKRLIQEHQVMELFDAQEKTELFDFLETRLETIPKEAKTFSGKVFSWLFFSIDKDDVFGMMINLLDFDQIAEIDKIRPYFKSLPIHHRETITQKILPDYYGWSYDESKERKPLTTYQRDFAFSVLKDRGEYMRNAAMRALKNAEIGVDEIGIFEEMLKRKSADMRKSVIGIILKQKAEVVHTSVGNLLKARNQEQRLAGLDMLVNLKSLPSEGDWVTEQAEQFAQNPKITSKEQVILDTLISEQSATLEYSADNGYGLFDPTSKTDLIDPKLPTEGAYFEQTQNNPLGISQPTEKIHKALQALKKLYLANQQHEYTYEQWDGSQATILLGNNFVMLKRDTKDMTDEEQFYNYPLADVWKKWAEDHQLTPLDIYLINLNAQIQEDIEDDEEETEETSFNKAFAKTIKALDAIVFVGKIPKIGDSYWHNPLTEILKTLPLIFPFAQKIDYLEGLCKTLFCNIHPDELHLLFEDKTRWSTNHYTWRNVVKISTIYGAYHTLTSQMNDVQFQAFWQLERWRNDTLPKDYPNDNQYLSDLEDYARAYQLQLVNKDELMKRIMQNDAIQALTRKKGRKEHYDIRKEYPFLVELINPIRDRILEIELRRGDSSTAVTKLAQSLEQIFGAQNFVDILVSLGKDNLHRGYIYSWGRHEYNKKEILSTLLKRCHPTSEDTQAVIDALIKTHKIKEKRLVEAATYAPQWLPLLAKNLGWKGMESAAWWLHAHTNAHHSSETEAEIGKYSKVAMNDFSDGAVDIDWFKEVYKALGKDRWKMLYDSAKYISEGNGHKRAMLYADVILGNTKITEVKKRVTEKRNQDYLRVFGLVPLSKKNRDSDLLKRYQYLQKFKKESKQFGSQRQASEGLAVRIAMENLARTAGFSDPIRLTWAMETEEAQTILNNAESLAFDDVSIQLIVDENGKSSLEIKRGDKQLKAVPAKLKKDKAVLALKEFNKTLQNQYKRTRKSLEDAMVNDDAFSLNEVTILMSHPVVAPMLQKLVLKSGDALGFWQEGALVSPDGASATPGDQIQVAHCTDLYAHKQWGAYQKHCFDRQIQQPFKQIFRELYVPTEDELNEKAVSRRYAGHQVQPQKTVALLKTRGWTVNYEEGLQKTFHKEGFIARMFAMADWFTPADVESPTLETVEFTDRKTWKNMAFDQLDPRIFSEVMRDIDLVVSVAHVGDVDPETSQSTIELRTAIVRETVRLFKLDNVELKGKHALIKGDNNEYSVHLGSAIAHKMPGVALSILPVHSQHRGRMFLPFLDEDPKTAEIMSKILLLAKEKEIQDPTILQQII
ncbi:MAG TPA: hypothetical protein DCS93_09995 [Microscillaceae bacterium]|nr:hypothetical protein [Microscillaceae bacterium]